jgi:hypothetical protein
MVNSTPLLDRSRIASYTAPRMSPAADAHPPLEGGAAYAACRPNISGAGRRRRTQIGYLAVMISVLLFGLSLAMHAAWYWRALLCLPAALAAVSFLQVRRNTCIARAAEGMFEHDDFSRTKAPDEDVAASRRVASTIRRDAALIGLAVGVLAALTALV